MNLLSKAIRWPDKDPDENPVAYATTFADRMDAAETIATATWSVTPVTASPITFPAQSLSGQQANVKVSGGLAGTKYSVLCHVTTSSAQVLEQTMTMRCGGR